MILGNSCVWVWAAGRPWHVGFGLGGPQTVCLGAVGCPMRRKHREQPRHGQPFWAQTKGKAKRQEFHPRFSGSEHRPLNPPHPCAGADLGEHRGVPDVAHPFHSVKNEFIPSWESVWLLWRVESRTSACALVALGMDPWGFVPWDAGSTGSSSKVLHSMHMAFLSPATHWEGPRTGPVARAKNRSSHSG